MMVTLSIEQREALDNAFSVSSSLELVEALEAFEQTLPPRSQRKREEIAGALIEELEGTADSEDKKVNRLLAALASIDTPNAADAVADYASKPGEISDRIPAWALLSLSRMSSYDDTCGLLERMVENSKVNSRLKALGHRLLIQCSDGDKETEGQHIEKLIEMGRDSNGDNRWAALRALRSGPNLEPLPAEIEKRFIDEMVLLSLRREFEWRDVQTQAVLVLGDIQEKGNFRDAIEVLGMTFQNSADARIQRLCIDSIHKIADQMETKAREESVFKEIMLKGLENDNVDVRSRAQLALKTVLKPKTAVEFIVDTLLSQKALSPNLVEALRNIDDEKASEALQKYLFHRNPDFSELASEALLAIGGNQAFQTLFAQRREAVDQYSAILNDADERVMKQYNSLMRQARLAFWVSLLMHFLVFAVGLFLLVFGFVFASGISLEGLISSAGGGLATYLGLFYKNPVKNIGQSVTRLVKVNVAFLGFMRQINQIDLTFKQNFLNAAGFDLNNMGETVSQIDAVVARSLESIQAYLGDGENMNSDS